MRWVGEWRDAIREARLPVYAANTAFFLLLSLFPAMALLLGLIGHLAFSQEEFFAVFQRLIPAVLLPLFQEAVAMRDGAASMLPVSALVSLWSASRGLYSLLQGLDHISRGRKRRNFLQMRLLALGFTVVFLLALVGTFALYTLGRTLVAFLAGGAPVAGWVQFLLARRSWIAFVFLSALFALIYSSFPPQKPGLRPLLPGSLLAAGGWVLFSWLFSLWATWFSNYPKVYGSVAIVALTMLWLYICLEIVLFGAIINETLSK